MGRVFIWVIDKLVSLFILVFFFPIILFLLIVVILYFKQSPIFKQIRAGKNGKPFVLFKIKTMINSDIENCSDDDHVRLNVLGKWLRKYSLDELLQFLNILKGDMSLVGPRPLFMEYIPLYNDEQRKRLNVMPGITGWAQINGRNSISWEERFKLDVWYVENCSFALNMKILVKTFTSILNHHHVNYEGHVTMPNFKGSKNE